MISTDHKRGWEQPDNIKTSEPSEAEKIAKTHGLSPNRAQMLIDRLGTDSEMLASAADDLRINSR